MFLNMLILLCESWTWLFLECSWPKQIRDLIFGMLTRAAVFQSPSCFYGILKKACETKLVGEMFMDSALSLDSFEKGYFSSKKMAMKLVNQILKCEVLWPNHIVRLTNLFLCNYFIYLIWKTFIRHEINVFPMNKKKN